MLSAPAGGLVSGQSALVRLAGTTPSSMVVKAPVALHAVYPSGQPPFDVARLFEEPELKTLADRIKDQEKNQKKALDRLANLFAEAKANAAAQAGRVARPRPRPACCSTASHPFARGEAPVVIRADEEKEIRASVRFAADNGLKLVIAGGLEAWRCADAAQGEGRRGAAEGQRLPSRESDPYDAPYANAARAASARACASRS